MHKVHRYNRVALHQARRYKDDTSSRLVQVNLFNRSLPPWNIFRRVSRKERIFNFTSCQNNCMYIKLHVHKIAIFQIFIWKFRCFFDSAFLRKIGIVETSTSIPGYVQHTYASQIEQDVKLRVSSSNQTFPLQCESTIREKVCCNCASHYGKNHLFFQEIGDKAEKLFARGNA